MDNINFPNNYFKKEVNICRSRHSDSFKTAPTYLSTVISSLLQATHTSLGRYGRRRQVSTGRRGGRGSQFEAVRVVDGDAEDEAKEIEIKVKMVLT